MSRTDFQLDAATIYLNHAAVAPWPQRTVQAVCEFARENGQYGSHNYPAWLQTEIKLREQLRSLLNARHSDEIALLKSTSEGISVIASGLDWKPGDNVVISNQEFPSNRLAWQALAPYGVETRIADLHSDISPENALLKQLDAHTRILSVSSVQYASGLRLDLDTLGAACRERGVLFCIDAIQSLGAHRMDVQTCHADFVVADGHKWMLGPEGVALFYCRQELIEQINLHQFGWHMLADVGNYDSTSLTFAASARRFECGSPNMLGIHALHASLGLLLETGMENVERQVLDNSRFLLDSLALRADRYRVITTNTPGRYAGIVTFQPLNVPSEQLFDRLKQHQVACALRSGGIRFSPHFHTPRDQLCQALELLERYG